MNQPCRSLSCPGSPRGSSLAYFYRDSSHLGEKVREAQLLILQSGFAKFFRWILVWPADIPDLDVGILNQVYKMSSENQFVDDYINDHFCAFPR